MRAAAQLVLIALLTLLASLVGFAVGDRWLLPVLDALPAYLSMILALRKGRRAAAMGMVLWWAVCLAAASVCFTIAWHDRAESVILNGPQYRDEMLAWLSTGTGRESTPSQFIPQHLLHAGAFCLLSLLTGGVLSILMGSALLNYMSFYVGDLILRCSGSPARGLAILLAWNPWSMVRILSFIILGVTLAEPLLSRLRGDWPSWPGRRRWIAVGLGGLLLDILMKSILAPLWPGLLGACFG